eukprot:CAMPEP_0202696608 /NCGR_PEP_ID=MMETSP1385-20130828/9900_1 /ASSEMBLY_ACC=CAM_ASM_000861 /TAXON_ID=933848 /ORGANISM="Elphidium margaritaceum" /LENGTH=494 /DNA_ID=CAMNT_0049352811 /DNA_START=23 /DNA_END=1507 /DNA_ORIENTATION=+
MACPYLNANDDPTTAHFTAKRERARSLPSVPSTIDDDDKTPAAQLHSTDEKQVDDDNEGKAKQKYTDCYYHDYLRLDQVLNANHPRSTEYVGSATHDEHLFITIHQAYELWFKQVLYELDSCITSIGSDVLDDRELLDVVSRLQRVNLILKLLVEQFSILDTMTPMNFLDFRKFLKPASGFQSVQFRLLENKLGLQSTQRMRYNQQDYTNVLHEEHGARIKQQQHGRDSLFDVIQKWLERFPYLLSHDWQFWTQYKAAVNEYILEEKELYMNHADLDGDMDEERRAAIQQECDATYAAQVQTFAVIFDEQKYEQLRRNGKVRLSYTALQSALMINLYREEPMLQMPFRVLELSMGVDNMLTQWRNAHALMVHRMLGSKMGTGGSSGFHYLRTAATHHKVFTDFFNLSTYMIPKSNLPQLPNSMRFFMNFPNSSTSSNGKQKAKDCFVRRADRVRFMQDIPPFPTIATAKSLSPHTFQRQIQEMKAGKATQDELQ